MYSEIVDQGNETPLGFSDQLGISLEQTTGDLPEALWRLFITSRHYGRGFDASVISDMPDFSREEKLERMYGFSHAVAPASHMRIHPYKMLEVIHITPGLML